MARVRGLLLALGLLLVLGVGLLLARTLHSVQREQALRHSLVSQRIFDELERELTELTLREEARSFLEYRYFFVPEGQVPGMAGLVRSPLSEPSSDPLILGYFQLEPGGTLYTPMRPRPSEQQLATDNYRAGPDGGVLAIEAQLVGLLATVSWDPAPVVPAVVEEEPLVAQVDPPARQGVQERTEDLYNTLNRAVSGRGSRSAQSVVQQRQAVEPFQQNEGDLQQVLDANLLASDMQVDSLQSWDDPQRYNQRQGDAAVEAAVPLRAEEQVDVEISPLSGTLLDQEHLALHRSVRIGAETWRQGLVLRVPALQAQLSAVPASSALARYVELGWGGDSARGRRYRYPHSFAAPFQDLTLSLGLDRIPAETPSGQVAVVLLGLVLLVLSALGGLVLYRGVAARVDYAQRRSDFVAAVSHELKTPLTSIRMMAEILRDGMLPDDQRRQEYYRTITAESERLSRLIGNVLELSRLERGSRQVQRVVGSVDEVLRQAVEVLEAHARQQGFALELDVAPELPAVAMDRDALLQALVNLVDNALKFAAGAEDRRVVLRAWRSQGRVCVAVRDHGPGVPERQLQRIFQPFFRGERELTRSTEGTGIGLALVAGLVERMGGTVRARNHPGGGLEVVLVLALAAG